MYLRVLVIMDSANVVIVHYDKSAYAYLARIAFNVKKCQTLATPCWQHYESCSKNIISASLPMKHILKATLRHI